MTEEDKLDLGFRIKQEGFHYTFLHYSDFKEIKDKKFHELRKEYLKSAEKLEKYLIVQNIKD